MDQEKIDAFRQQQAEEANTAKQDGQHEEITSSLNNLLLATMVSKDPKMVEVAQNLAELLGKIGEASSSFEGSSLHLLPIANQELAMSIQELAGRIEQYSPHDLQPYFEDLAQKLNVIAKNKPVVNVPTQPVTVDLKPLITAIDAVKKEVTKNKVDIPKSDFGDIVKGLKAVQKQIADQTFPVPNYVLPFKDVNGKATQVQLDSSGNVPTVTSFTPSGTQDVNITKVGGNAVTTTIPTDVAELPAAAALADGAANPTTTTVGANNSLWNSAASTWSRWLTPSVGDAAASNGIGSIAIHLWNGATYDRWKSGAQSNVAAATGYAASLGIAQYNATPPTITDTRYNHLQSDINANLRVTLATNIAGEDSPSGINVMGVVQKPVVSSTYAPSTYQQSGSVTKANIKASAGNVYFMRITNANAAVRYFQLHNKATAPAAADTAQLYFIVPAGTATNPSVLELNTADLAPSEYFTTGIGWAISTTATTFTDSGTASDHNTSVRFM